MRRWWLGYACAVSIVICAMSWLTWMTVSTHAQNKIADRVSFADDTARLALWRIDTRLTALMAREAGRPYVAYHPFYPATGAIHRDLNQIEQGDVIIPSPLLGLQQDEVLLHFQFNPDLESSSPQVPLGTFYNAAVPSIVTASQVSEAARRLNLFSSRVSGEALTTALENAPAISRETTIARLAFACQNPMMTTRSQKEVLARQTASIDNLNDSQQSTNYNPQQQIEQFNSANSFSNSVIQKNKQSLNSNPSWLEPNATALDAEIMRPVWINDNLVLARRVIIDEHVWLQGCWLDWPSLRSSLLDDIHDLLPDAKLTSLCADTGSSSEITANSVHVLATLPVQLIPGNSLPDWPGTPSDHTFTMIILAWCGVVAALSAGGILLFGALQLSERRGTFVSAVTHELRTPLTTFRLYTDLLADGHVSSEDERQQCLLTLRTEADRLGHLVENVMSYARLERQPLPTSVLSITTLMDDIKSRLHERATRSQLILAIQISPRAAPRAIRGDPHAIERILGNLVDNACKYAASATDRRLHVDVDVRGHFITCSVRDHGPGIPPHLISTLFQPFSKSAATAAETAPGIGLGLALSRRLAQQLGGNLSYISHSDGAVFVLELQLAT